MLRAPSEAIPARVQQLLDERRVLERRIEEAMRGGGDRLQGLVAGGITVGKARVVAGQVQAGDVRELQAMGDALREQLGTGVGVLAASFGDGKNTLVVVVTDDLRERGVRADAIIREIAAQAGGRGGGKPHLAQAGIPDATRIPDALAAAPELVRPFIEQAS